ncbi:hypothetical protein [Algivirga pacifica]|uniref:Tetratricopeptide repeat-containing protein n=1 Tax=Algivirga pacifica TaxID=1162670 RepID=A0ABP9DDC8_9BACT
MTITLKLNEYTLELLPDIRRFLPDPPALKHFIQSTYQINGAPPKVLIRGKDISIILPNAFFLNINNPLYEKADTLYELGHLEEAKAACLQLTKECPPIAEYHYLHSRVLHQMHETEAAIKACKQALQWAPDYQEAIELIGKIYAHEKTDIETAMIFINHNCNG